MSLTRKLPRSTGFGVTSICARRYTAPVTATSCDASAVMPSSLLPVPSDSKSIVATPDLSPAVAVSIATVIDVLSVCCGPSRLNDPPFVVTPPVVPPTLAFNASEKPSSGASLVIDTA